MRTGAAHRARLGTLGEQRLDIRAHDAEVVGVGRQLAAQPEAVGPGCTMAASERYPGEQVRANLANQTCEPGSAPPAGLARGAQQPVKLLNVAFKARQGVSSGCAKAEASMVSGEGPPFPGSQ
jgi:hypothetical protein